MGILNGNSQQSAPSGFLRVLCVSVVKLLVLAAAVLGRPVYLLAGDACTTQPDFTAAFLTRYGSEPNAPAAFGGLPVLGPVASDPNAWAVPCGPARLAYTWCDPEGMLCSGEVVAADLPCELTLAEDGRASLTIPRVTYGWHVVHVRITDQPPEGAEHPASRDVCIVFFGEYGPNRAPILY